MGKYAETTDHGPSMEDYEEMQDNASYLRILAEGHPSKSKKDAQGRALLAEAHRCATVAKDRVHAYLAVYRPKRGEEDEVETVDQAR